MGPSSPESHSSDRASSEVAAYAEGDFMAARNRVRSRIRHFYQTPNNLRMQRVFMDLVLANLNDNTVLEIGCGTGWNCKRILDLGAKAVHGIDIAESMLNRAIENYSDPDLRFSLHDIHKPIDGHYDLIIGQAVLHHVEYKIVLKQLFERSLNPGGKMFFLEPMAEGLLTRLYWKVSPHMHTPDERPFYANDIRWLKQAFPGFELLPYGYFSFPVGAMSALIMRSPDNVFTRLSDRADEWMAKRFLAMGPRYHSGIFCIQKPQ